MKTACVGEALSVPLLSATMRSATHPLIRAVLERIVKDESPHARLGWLYLEWAADKLDADERERLAEVALEALRDLSGYWRALPEVKGDQLADGTRVADLQSLGWMDPRAYREAARAAVRNAVVRPLAAAGIRLSERAVSKLA